MSPVQTLASYEKAARRYGVARGADDIDTAIGAHDECARLYRALRRRGRYAQNLLLELHCHDDPWVRGWAAFHTLDFAPERGEETLETLTSRDDLVGTTFERTVSRWRQGTVGFPDAADPLPADPTAE